MPALGGLWCAAALFAVGVVGIAFGRSRAATALVYGASLAITLAALLLALTFLLAGGSPASMTLPLGLPWIGAHFRLDPLAAFFLIVVNLGGAVTSAYALGYGRHETAPLRVLPYYPVFLGAMNLVVLADDAFVFLLSWEFMSLVSWGMVVAHHRVPSNLRAGFIYLVMASFGTLCLLLAFGVLAGAAGEYSFAAMRAAPLAQALALVAGTLTLVGAGSKAGIVPLHVWLPLAHPAAPSHVSALLSGVMTKVGVYGFIRIVFDLIGEPTPYSGLIVAGIGGITATLGVLYALMQHDIKRLLAYHTVENIGIIFIGLGLALAFRANSIGWAAACRPPPVL
jgi:formate hydrogenlyase subunit 3/multisubunit Na+/H+ antiporter MnhD subunit